MFSIVQYRCDLCVNCASMLNCRAPQSKPESQALPTSYKQRERSRPTRFKPRPKHLRSQAKQRRRLQSVRRQAVRAVVSSSSSIRCTKRTMSWPTHRTCVEEKASNEGFFSNFNLRTRIIIIIEGGGSGICLPILRN